MGLVRSFRRRRFFKKPWYEKSGQTRYRWQSASMDKAYDLIRDRVLIETNAEHPRSPF